MTTSIGINERFIAQPRPTSVLEPLPAWDIYDRYKSEYIGILWTVEGGTITFLLRDGRARFGGYGPVLKSLRAMLPANKPVPAANEKWAA